ncbi:MAG: ribulose-phosphate 3-epimerase [Weeksellaceae bacterium]
MAIIAPSVLAADFLHLEKDLQVINNSKADWFHLDIMDGVFVPNISYGMPIMQAIKEVSNKPLDVHLMIVQPERYIQKFADLGADILTIHYEASTHLHRSLQAIKNAGMKRGVALNPHTPINHLENIITDIDVLLIMSVNPGFGGQKFIDFTFDKIIAARELIERKGASTLIEIDGGVNTSNASALIEAGAHALVAGSAVFGSENPTGTIEQLKNF